MKPMLFCRKVNRMTKTNQKIPEGWSVKKLGEIGTFVSGGTPDTEKAEYWNGDIVWLTPSEITKLKTRFISDSERKITKLGLKNSSAVLLPKNSLIICTRATIGDCCINTKEVSTNQGFKNLIPNNNCTDFLYYLISIHKSDLIRRACGSTFLEISKHDIEKLKYVFPPLAEQEKIAEILSCWDEGIEKLSALIEKKKIQKKALMQQLLTGKHRLKGFATPWHEVKLGDISDLYQPQTISQNDLGLNGYPVYGANGLIGYYHKFNHETWQIMITCRGSTCGTVNRTNGKSWITGNAMVVNVDNYENNKLFLYFKLLNENFLSIVSGSGQPQIVRTPLKKWKLYITSDLTEQKAIADILSKADEEIELLNKKLEAFKLEKKALMKQLLTGQIRVKVN